MSEPIHIISLGAGVQSSVMALMATRGELTPMPVCAVFADTMAEPKSVYTWLDWLETKLSFPVVRVNKGSLTVAALSERTNKKTGKRYYSNMIPAYVRNADGTKGIVERHCTYNHKIIPIIQEFRRQVSRPSMKEWRAKHKAALSEYSKWKNAKSKEKPPFPHESWKELQSDPLVIQWIGISMDEVQRMKPSREPWIVHRWPLIEKRMTRHACLTWADNAGLPKPPRSACSYCPFHSDQEWQRLKTQEPEAFEDAVKFEKDLQRLHDSIESKGKIKGIPFLHDSLTPLSDIDFSNPNKNGQKDLFINECEGICGV